MIGHGFCCILFELALLLVSYRTATNTVLTSSNKNETAVHGCSPVLSGFCRVVVSQSQFFHVVSALQFVLQCTEVTMVMAVVTIVLFRCHLVFTTKSTGPRQERGGGGGIIWQDESRYFTFPYFFCGIVENRKPAAILVCNGECILGRVPKLPRGAGVGQREAETDQGLPR